MTDTIARLTPEQESEVRRLKQYFPYRIVYAAINGEQFECNAVTTMRWPNKLAREGWTVFTCR